MKNVVIIIFISIFASATLLFLIGSIGISSLPVFMAPVKTLSDAIVPKLPVEIDSTPDPVITKEMILAAINRVRHLSKVPILQNDSTLCPLSTLLISNQNITAKQITTICPNCNQLVSVTFDKRASLATAIQYIEDNATASSMVKNKKLTSACLEETDNKISFIAAQKINPPTPKPERFISEDELFQALSEYRHDHGASSLNKDEKLCEYARKRVQDHITLLNSHLPKEAYPMPEKYPLDGHDGFKKDADSKILFEMTGKHLVAENLAFWPTAEYGTHVIEWGWDTSKEGHRETQLSNDYDSVCLSGSQGFFVATFGK